MDEQGSIDEKANQREILQSHKIYLVDKSVSIIEVFGSLIEELAVLFYELYTIHYKIADIQEVLKANDGSNEKISELIFTFSSFSLQEDKILEKIKWKVGNIIELSYVLTDAQDCLLAVLAEMDLLDGPFSDFINTLFKE